MDLKNQILSTLLFAIYISDHPQTCGHLKIIFLFADDTNIKIVGQSKATIQQDLNLLAFWLQVNKLCLNTEKTYQINVKSAQSSKDLRDSLSLSRSVIKNTPNYKYFGVLLDNKLSFNAHISLVMEKLSRQCGILPKLLHYVPWGSSVRFRGVLWSSVRLLVICEAYRSKCCAHIWRSEFYLSGYNSLRKKLRIICITKNIRLKML